MERNKPDTIYFVDKFLVPKNSMEEFIKQVNYNRAFVAKLKGYIRGEAFEKPDSGDRYTVVTVAVWESQARLHEAKEAVQMEFKRICFDPIQFYQRLNIKLERELYSSLRD